MYQGAKAQEYQQQAADAQRKQANLQAARERRDAVRQARIAMAATSQNAANQGASTSSAFQGGYGSIQSQLGSNLSFLDQFNKFGTQAAEAIGNANQAAFNSQIAGGIASLAGQGLAAGFGGGSSKLNQGSTSTGGKNVHV